MVSKPSEDKNKTIPLQVHIWIYAKMDYMLGYKANINKFQRTAIIQCMYSDHLGTQLEYSNQDNKQISKYLEIMQHTSK